MSAVYVADAAGRSTCARCGGEGYLEEGVARDEFGNWDTEERRCPDCDGRGGP